MHSSITNMSASDVLAYRDLIDQFPAAHIVEDLVSIFFNEANWYFAVLDQYCFDQMHVVWNSNAETISDVTLMSTMRPELLQFSALLFQVCALALQFIPPSAHCGKLLGLTHRAAEEQLSKSYSEMGNSMLALLQLLPPSIISVQAHLMRCAWLKNSGFGAQSWDSIVMAVR